MRSPKHSQMQCVLASGNKGKLAELSEALSSHGIRLRAQSEFNVSEVAEPASTFVENALIKARHASHSTGLAALADDSGLVVPSLQGQPGVHSARYAANNDDAKPGDSANIDKLLNELATQPADQRNAYFVCVLVYLSHADDPLPVIATGLWHGTILKERRGDSGFGYDPVFYCDAEQLSAAEMGKARKQQISHRAIALAALSQQLALR